MARILLTDDDDAFRQVMTRLLELTGHEVVPVENGRDAICQQLARPADVVLCDVVMPGMSGAEAITAIRSLTPRAGIIAISGAAAYSDRWNSAAAAADRILPKPCSYHDIVDAIESVLDRVAARSTGAMAPATVGCS